MKKLNKKGVSLAELLAVVVIMGIIAAIAIPLVGNVIETSKKKAFLGDLVTVAEATRTYCLVEGKDTEGICNKSAGDAGVLLVKPAEKLAGGITLEAGDATKLQSYISKSLIDIADRIAVKRDGEKYLVAAISFEGGYNTAGKTVSPKAEMLDGNFIDPTVENIIDSINKSNVKDDRTNG